MFLMAADGHIASNGAIDCIVEIEMYVCHVKNTGSALIHFQMFDRDWEFLHRGKDFTSHNGGDFFVDIQFVVESCGTECCTHGSSLDNCSHSHLESKRRQLFSNSLAQFL
jgi:hypothetical protein